jgi:hypothetical protein
LRAFNSWMPEEMYFGNGNVAVIDLATARVKARQERMKAKPMAACGVCTGGPELTALQLQRVESSMC